MNGLTMISRKKPKMFWKQLKMNTKHPKPLGHSEDNPERKVHSDTGIPKKEEKDRKDSFMYKINDYIFI